VRREGPDLVTDAYIAALAIEHRYEFLTTGRLRALPGLLW